MIKLVEPEKKLTRLAGLWLIGGYASSFPTILSLISSNITGHTKKAVVSAVLFLGFCTGYIIGPLTFIAAEAPNYPVSTTWPMSEIVADFGFDCVQYHDSVLRPQYRHCLDTETGHGAVE